MADLPQTRFQLDPRITADLQRIRAQVNLSQALVEQAATQINRALEGPPTSHTHIASDITDFDPADYAPAKVPENAQTGTSYTLVLSDASKLVSMDNAGANTLTIPTDASVAFPANTTLVILQKGAGTTTVAGAAGVTVNGVNGGSGDILAQWGAVNLFKSATDTWYVMGAIGTVA